MKAITAYAKDVHFERKPTSFSVYEGLRGIKIAHVDIIRGFLHYQGLPATAHEDVTAVISSRNIDFIETLRYELLHGIKNGRDDRR